jgi:hypothetical protein
VGSLRSSAQPHDLGHLDTKSLAEFGIDHLVICPRCGLALPPVARYCARCGAQLRAETAPGAAPVWLLTVFWVGGAGLLYAAAFYGGLATGLLTPRMFGSAIDPAQIQSSSAVMAVCLASLAAGHAAAALGLMGGRSWGRTFATMVCVVWALTCVGLPLGLFGISTLWRGRRSAVSA